MCLFGANATANSLGRLSDQVIEDNRKSIQAILKAAGLQKEPNDPTGADLKHCSRRPFFKALLNMLLGLLIIGSIPPAYLMCDTVISWFFPYPTNDLQTHIATLKRLSLQDSEDRYRRVMTGKRVTWKATVEFIRGSEGGLSVKQGGQRYDITITFRQPVSVELGSEITITGELTKMNTGGATIVDAVIVAN